MATSSKRTAILDAALALFAERGYDGTTVPAIAEKAQVGAGTIYRYFENKEVLVNSLFRASVQELSDTLVMSEQLDGTPIRQRFSYFFRRMIEFADRHEQSLAFIDAHSGAPVLDEDSRQAFQSFMDHIRTVIDEGKLQGLICPLPSDVLIAIVYGSLVKLYKILKRGVVEETPDLLEQVEECCWNAIRVH